MPVMAVTALLMNVSCSSDDMTASGEQQSEQSEMGFTAVARTMEYDVTRSSLDFSSKGMVFQWTGDDVLTVFAENNDEAKQEYSLRSGAGTPNAKFSSKDFDLTVGKRYFSLSKTENTAGGATRIPDQNNITLDYAGQVQKGNANTSHLGKYDYMVASALCEGEPYTHFDFYHLGLTLRIVMSADGSLDEAQKTAFANTKFKSLEIYDSENSFRQQSRLFSFAAGTTAEGYTPTWPEQEITGDDRFTLTFDGEGVKPSADHVDGTSNDGKLVAYIELPSADPRGKTIGFILKGTNEGGNDVVYYGTYNGFNMKMDKAYQIPLNMKPTTDFYATLKINHNWQLGATTDLTRGTGDPGYDDDLYIPTYLYYIFCVDNNVKKVAPITGGDVTNAVNSIVVSGVDDNKWTTTTTDGKTISTYGQKLVFKLQDSEKNLSKHLYVVASRTALPAGTFAGIAENTPETTVRALTYDLQGKTSINAPLDDSQKFLRDLYSTPWDASNFVGNLVDPMQDVILYHVAAKVDLKWNAEIPMTPSTHEVKISSVNSTGLSLFNPTTAGGTSANYTVTTPITYGTMINGRQVFYLPQYNTYSTTIGTFAGSSTFTPATTNGFTSWLRWMKII